MGDIELSLDDIIKKKTFKKTDLKRNRNNAGNTKKPIRRINDSNNRTSKPSAGILSRNSNVKGVRGAGPQANIGDARNKIIQKQRNKMTDAREKLSHIAKQSDARLRLLKLREHQRGNASNLRLTQVRGLIDHSVLQRTVQPHMGNSFYEEELMDYTLSNPTYPDRSFSERAVIEETGYGPSYRSKLDGMVLYRTVENNLPLDRLYKQEKPYSLTKSVMSSLDDYLDIPLAKSNTRILMGRSEDICGNSTNWDLDDTPIVITKRIKPQETVGILKRSSGIFDGQTVKITKESPPPSKNLGPIRTLSDRFCQGGNESAQKISLLKAKLEASQKNKNNLESQTSVGHRIVVSNLVPSVTHEDVKELFEDIGELISSKVVRPGTAEVVYKLHKDAVRAVDVYHNRQLDGQPMKCLLVNNKTAEAMGSKLLKGVDRKLNKSVVELDMTAFRKALHKKSTS